MFINKYSKLLISILNIYYKNYIKKITKTVKIAVLINMAINKLTVIPVVSNVTVWYLLNEANFFNTSLKIILVILTIRAMPT